MIQNKQIQSRIRVLLVEDDEDVRGALVTRLKKRNCDVTAAVTAEEGLELLEQGDFEVVVSDIKLPKMDGIGFLRKARELRDGLPVILLTGYASLDTAKEAVKLNAYDYLLKPLDNINELIRPIQEAAHSYRLLRENKELTSKIKAKINDLEKSKQEYRVLFELASDIIFTTDRKGKITAINQCVEEVTGYTPSDLIGHHMGSLLSSYHDHGYKKQFQDVIEGTKKTSVEVRLVSKNESHVIAELAMRPIQINNEVIGMHGILRDITKRKEIEENLKQKIEELNSWKRLTAGRELDMRELKQEVDALLRKQGQTS